MIKVIPIALSCLSTVAIVGCGGAPRAVTWPEARPWGADLPSYRAPRHPIPTDEDARAFAEPGGQLTQHDAFAAALLHNRDLATFAWDVRIREARALQASLPPNPEIELELEEFGGTGDASAFDAAETTALFSQLIELGQKRRKRTRLAELNQDLAAWEYETARVRVLTSVARAFIATLVLQQQTELANRNQALAREAYDTIDKRVAAGAA